VCDKLIGWKMDGWIGLSGCGCGKWIVESGAVPDLTLTTMAILGLNRHRSVH